MVDLKISAASSAGVLDGTEEVPVARVGSGAALHTTTQDIADLSTGEWSAGIVTALGSGLAITGTTLNTTSSGATFATSISAAGANQGAATAITANVNVVTTVAASTGVRLALTPTAGFSQQVFNRGANTLLVYPASGAAIESAGANAAVSIVVGGSATFTANTGTQWYAA